MALFFHNQKLTNLSHADKPFDTLEHTGHVIYRNRVAPGTVLWAQGKAFGLNGNYGTFNNSNLLINQAVSLAKPISKLKTGLKFIATKALYENDPNNGGEATMKYTVGNLKTDTTAGTVFSDANGAPDNFTVQLTSATMEASVADLNSGNKIKIASVTQDLVQLGTITIISNLFVQKVSDTQIAFVSDRESDYGGKTMSNSTAFQRQYDYYNGWIIIDSIQAY